MYANYWSRPIYKHAVQLKTNVIGPIDRTSSMVTLPFAARTVSWVMITLWRPGAVA